MPVVLWSHYAAAREKVAFVRVGTLDDPSLCPPDIHIFTSARQSWVRPDPATPSVEHYYRRSEFWPAASIERYWAVTGR